MTNETIQSDDFRVWFKGPNVVDTDYEITRLFTSQEENGERTLTLMTTTALPVTQHNSLKSVQIRINTQTFEIKDWKAISTHSLQHYNPYFKGHFGNIYALTLYDIKPELPSLDCKNLDHEWSTLCKQSHNRFAWDKETSDSRT